MEFWFSEFHTPDVKHSIRVNKQLYSKQSDYQRIDIFETPEFGRVLTLDGNVMLTERDEFIYDEMIVHVPMAVHKEAKDILVIGAGDGGVVRELTRYDRVERIDLVEMDPQVVEACRAYLPGNACRMDDRRVHIYFENALKYIRRCEEEYDLIIGGGWQSGDAVNKGATEYPDAAHYALIDSEVEAENVKCISYREQEGAYLIGALAALTTDGESHKYGAVHVNEGPGSWKWRYGYMEGVKSIDPDAEFVFNYTGSYSDPAKAKELAIQQYEQGCVFINSAAAGGDSGTFEAAKEKGFYTSGQDVDLTDPENPYIVSSQIKDTYQSVWNLIDEFFSGNYTDENSVWGVAEGTIGAVYVTHDSPNPRSERLSDDDIAQLKQIAEDIRTGALDLTNYPTEEEYFAN